MPDIEKVSSALRCLDWQPVHAIDCWTDGEILLVAVPVCDDTDWHYEFSVITVNCDMDFFGVTCEGETWGWELDDVDWCIAI